MTMAKRRLRNDICTAIASVGAKGGQSMEIGSRLDEIFARKVDDGSAGVASDRHGVDADENDDNITPLMLACDKCCTEAVDYLRNQIVRSVKNRDGHISLDQIIEAWGHPTEVSSCGNSAMMHALAAGFCDGFDILVYMMGCVDANENDRQSNNLHQTILLLSQTNENGDSPIMMACVSGHMKTLKHILEYIFKQSLGPMDCSDDTDGIRNIRDGMIETWQSVRDVFLLKNSEECTALNLACGYCHEDIVEFLVRPQSLHVHPNNITLEIIGRDNSTRGSEGAYKLKPLVDVSPAGAEYCKKSLDNITAGLKFMKEHNQVDRVKEFENQYKQAKACLDLIESELERISTETANELLLVDTTKKSESARKHSTSKAKTKKKNKKKQKNIKAKVTNAGGISNTSDVGGANKPQNDDATGPWSAVTNKLEELDRNESTSVNTSPFITLQDGSIVSKSQKAEHTSSIPDDSASSSNDATSDKPTKPKTLQSILQSTSASSVTTEDDIAATMESLCLDPSMLLLSPHGMAMEMSPCQLDAIESILTHQLRATKEAQNIQSRLLDKK